MWHGHLAHWHAGGRFGCEAIEGIDIRCMWLRTVAEKMVYTLKQLSREDKPSDMLTRSPAKDDLNELLPMIGIYPLTVMKRAVEIVKTVLRTYPHMEQQVAAMMIMMMVMVIDCLLLLLILLQVIFLHVCLFLNYLNLLNRF